MIGLKVLLNTVVISLFAFPGIVPVAAEKRIVGGFIVNNTVPYQVSIRYYGSHACAGSLIRPNIVLTVAHCVIGQSTSYMTLVMGSNDLNEGTTFQAKAYIYHENYSSFTTQNDIALIFLSDAAQMSDNINVIPLAKVDPAVGTTVLATGWGTLAEVGQPPSKLRGVYLETISLQNCRDSNIGNVVDDNNICAYGEGKGPCKGDSGGPLVANNTLVGIISWGEGCARKGKPGVYTSVAKHQDWIEKNIES